MKRLNENILEIGILAILLTALILLMSYVAYPLLIAQLAGKMAWGATWLINLIVAGVAGAVVIALGGGVIKLGGVYQSVRRVSLENNLLIAKAERERIVTGVAKAGDTFFSNVPLHQYQPSVLSIKPNHNLWVNQLGGNIVQGQQVYKMIGGGEDDGNDLPAIAYGQWWPSIIRELKHEFDEFDQALSVRISGNPGSGKTVLVRVLLAELIKPFKSADIAILDRKASDDPQKWGNLTVLAGKIEDYPQAMAIINNELSTRSKDSEPLFCLIDEVDEAHGVFKDEFDDKLRNIQAVGREKCINPFVVGQSPLTKSSGIDSVSKTFFRLWVIMGLEAIENFLSSSDCKYPKADKDTYKQQLKEIESNRFICLVIPPRLVSKPFLSVLPHLEPPTINQTKRRSILDLPIALEKSEPEQKSDFEKLKANSDKLRYRHGSKVILSSICDILDWPNAGSFHKKARDLADRLEAENSTTTTKTPQNGLNGAKK